MDQPPVPLSHERLTEPTPVDPAASDALQWHYDPGFSRLGTMVAALVFCLCVGHVGYLVWTADRLDRVALPERALSHMVSRTMDVEEALGRAPEWERTLYEWLSGGDVSEREHAMVWYQELSERTADPLVHLQLAILQAESGGVPKVERRVKQWHRREAPFPLFARLLSAAYLKAPVDPDGVTELQAELAELLPAGWFYDRVGMRLAQRGQDRDFLHNLEQAAESRAAQLFVWSRWLSLVELVMLLTGSSILIRWWRGRSRDQDWLRYGAASLPPRWPGGLGARVLVRGGAIGAVLMLGYMYASVLYSGGDHPILRMLVVPLTNLPLLVMAQRHLLDPAGVGFRDGFGLRPLPGRWPKLLLAVPALAAAGLAGEWLVGRLAQPLNLSSHWTEWFDGDLVWAPTPVLLLSLVEYVVFAPIFEELAFRGLLFGVLRRRVGFVPSALVSAGLFAVAHGYGVLGFVGVFWSGMVWAWGYEKTGSLLPGMIAHGLNNLLVCLSVIALLRP